MPIDILLSVGGEAEKEKLEVRELVKRMLAQGRSKGKEGGQKRKRGMCQRGRSKMRRREGVGH